MAQLFGVAENNITYHIRGIYKTQELDRAAITQKIRVVQHIVPLHDVKPEKAQSVAL